MGDLREKMLKAGLITEDQAKKATQVERQVVQQKGHRQADRERQERQRAGAVQQDQRAAAERERGARERQVQLDDETKGRLKQLAQSGKLEGRTRGQRRWYYTSRRGVVPYLEVSDEVIQLLEQGGAAIAEAPSGDAWLITRECAQKLHEAHQDGAREWLRVWNTR